MSKNEKIKRIIAMFITITFLISSFPITVIAENDNINNDINLKITRKPNIDVIITKNDSQMDLEKYKKDVEAELINLGVKEGRASLKISDSQKILTSDDINIDEIVNNWPQYGAITWTSENGKLYSRTGGGTNKPSWWGTIVLDPNGYNIYDYNCEFTMATGGNLNEGACFNVTRNEDGSFNGYFMSICNHLNNECRLWKFNHYTLDQAFNSGINEKMWCSPIDNVKTSWTVGNTTTFGNDSFECLARLDNWKF